jgi:hypothetical protein
MHSPNQVKRGACHTALKRCRKMAAYPGMAHPLLGPSGGEAGTHNAGAAGLI